MYIHPNSVGFNGYESMPELFQDHGIDFMHFCTALGFQNSYRPSDYFLSGGIMFASLGTKDMNLLFSGVQRLNGYEHKDFQDYLKSKAVRKELLNIPLDADLSIKLDELTTKYNTEYSMSRQINNFYRDYLNDEDKQLLLGKISIPASYYANFSSDTNANIKYRIDFLLKIRNGLDHAATYHPLSFGGGQPEHIRFMKGSKEFTFLVWLTFEELYEITRKATANYWLEQYHESLEGGMKAKIDLTIAQSKAETTRLNNAHKPV